MLDVDDNAHDGACIGRNGAVSHYGPTMERDNRGTRGMHVIDFVHMHYEN